MRYEEGQNGRQWACGYACVREGASECMCGLIYLHRYTHRVLWDVGRCMCTNTTEVCIEECVCVSARLHVYVKAHAYTKHLYDLNLHFWTCLDRHMCVRAYLISIALITGNSSLESLLEGLFAQIHVNLSGRVFGRNQTRDLRITEFLKCRALHH